MAGTLGGTLGDTNHLDQIQIEFEEISLRLVTEAHIFVHIHKIKGFQRSGFLKNARMDVLYYGTWPACCLPRFNNEILIIAFFNIVGTRTAGC